MCAGLFCLRDRDIICDCMPLATFCWNFMPRLLQSRFSTKCSGLIRPLSLAGCITFTTRVKDGDNHCGFVCFARLPFFLKGQCLRMPLREDMHAFDNTKNRWNAVEPDLHCTFLLLWWKDRRFSSHINQFKCCEGVQGQGQIHNQ